MEGMNISWGMLGIPFQREVQQFTLKGMNAIDRIKLFCFTQSKQIQALILRDGHKGFIFISCGKYTA
jgi:hypothetical protein